MSRYLAETNGESAFRLFNKRTVYRGILQKKRHNNIVQMDVAEKILYGRIDKTFLPITDKHPTYLSIISIVFAVGGLITAIEHIWRLYKFKDIV